MVDEVQIPFLDLILHSRSMQTCEGVDPFAPWRHTEGISGTSLAGCSASLLAQLHWWVSIVLGGQPNRGKLLHILLLTHKCSD